MTAGKLLALCVALAAVHLSGCIKRLDLALQGVSIENDVSVSEPVSPSYSQEQQRPAVVVFVSSSTDLEDLARRLEVVHVFFDLHACASRWDGDFDLFGGQVFKGTSRDRIDLGVGEGDNTTLYYKVYVPTNTELLRRYARLDDTDFTNEIAKAHATGLCITVAGGRMLGGFRSNPIKIPVQFQGESLGLVQVSVVPLTPMRPTTEGHPKRAEAIRWLGRDHMNRNTKPGETIEQEKPTAATTKLGAVVDTETGKATDR